MKRDTLPVRVEGELKAAFQRIATSRGTTASALIRAFMAETVADWAGSLAEPAAPTTAAAPQPSRRPKNKRKRR